MLCISPVLGAVLGVTLSECLFFFGSCIFNDDLDSILYVPLLIVYSVGSGVVSPKLCNFGNLKLRWRLHPYFVQC